jgi:glycosyltransferase involved in cell wall biosynthesis
MKILMTSLLDMARDRNGVVTVARELLDLLEAAGHPVQMITPSNAALCDRDVILRVIRRFWRLTQSPAAFLLHLLLTIKHLGRRITSEAHDIDAVIAHDVLTADAALSAVAGNCPILLICHFWTKPWEEFSDAGLLPAQGIIITHMRRRMEKVLDHSRITLVPVSQRNEKLVRDMVPNAPQHRIQLAYPGVSRPIAAGTSTPHADGVPTLINVGKLDRRKNQQILPPVASVLKEMGFPCRFLLVGPGNPEEKYRIEAMAASLGVDDRFTFTGELDRKAVFNLMTQADLYLHTSLEESFGMTLVEAMACNLPVMALAYEALNEILPDTPEAIIPRNATPGQIAARIAPLLKDTQRLNDLQARQRVVYERRFSAEAFVSRYLEIIANASGMNS